MFSYIARRILLAIPIAFGVSVVCFSLVYLAPGDPLSVILPADATRHDWTSRDRCRSGGYPLHSE